MCKLVLRISKVFTSKSSKYSNTRFLFLVAWESFLIHNCILYAIVLTISKVRILLFRKSSNSYWCVGHGCRSITITLHIFSVKHKRIHSTFSHYLTHAHMASGTKGVIFIPVSTVIFFNVVTRFRGGCWKPNQGVPSDPPISFYRNVLFKLKRKIS